MVALTFSLLKKLHLYRDEQSKSRWQDRGEVKSVQGSVVLVVGVGDIGRNYAGRMKALGSYIIGVDCNAYAKPDFIDEIFLLDKLDELLPRADVTALIIPGTKQNAGLMSRARLAKMKKGSILINAGRGTLVDTDAVCDALESGALGGAGLEVTEPEPLPPEHRLWKLENAVITPHVAGGNHLPDTFRNIMKLSLENARRFVKGEALESVVDYKTGFGVRKY
jgi:phosphoglycerate dehydrogenase-like enzyme